MERSATVSEAAHAAGIGRRTVYDRRDRDQEFAEAWNDTLESAIEQLEQEAVRRAKDGSDLLMFLLRARRPAVYSERYRITHAHRIEERPEIIDIANPPRAALPAREQLEHSMRLPGVAHQAAHVDEVARELAARQQVRQQHQPVLIQRWEALQQHFGFQNGSALPI